MDTTHDRRATTPGGALSRRAALRGLGGAGLAAALGIATLGHAAADDGDRIANALFGSDPRAARGEDPAAVVAAYAAAVNAGDLAGILTLYADDAVHVALPAPDGSAGVCVGKEQLRLFYEQGVANGDRLEVVDGTLEVAGARVTFVARLASGPWRELGLGALEANVEAVVEDGRFATHVVMLAPRSVRHLMTALGTIPAPWAGVEPGAEAHRHGPR